MKRLALLTATALATGLGLLLIWLLGEVLGLFLASVALAAALRPSLAWLKVRGVSEGWAILLCYAGIVLALTFGVSLYGSLLGTELAFLLDNLPGWYDGLRMRLSAGAAWQQSLASGLPSTAEMIAGFTSAGLASVGTTLLGLSSFALSGAVYLVGVLSLAYYWLVDQSRFERLWLSLLPVPTRVRSRSIWRAAEREVGVYVRAEAFVVALVALVLSAAFTRIGVPFPTLLGLAGGLAQLVPWLGGPLLTLGAAGVALIGAGLPAALLVLAVGAAIELLLTYVLRPRLYRSAQKLNSLLVVLLLLVLATLGGPLAVLLAPPLAALIQVVYNSTVLDPQRLVRNRPLPELERLSDRATALEHTLAQQPDAPPELASIVQRVRTLMQRAEGDLQARS